MSAESIVVSGNPVDGFIYTAVPDGVDAAAFAEEQGFETDWWIAPLRWADEAKPERTPA